MPLSGKMKELKKAAWDIHKERDVLCNFYIASTGIVYEGRGWGIKVTILLRIHDNLERDYFIKFTEFTPMFEYLEPAVYHYLSNYTIILILIA